MKAHPVAGISQSPYIPRHSERQEIEEKISLQGDSVSISAPGKVKKKPARKKGTMKNLSAMAGKVFSEPEMPAIRTKEGLHAVISGCPMHQAGNGTITFLDHHGLMEVDPATLEEKIAAAIPYKESPDFHGTSCSEDGTFYYFNQGGSELKGFKDGTESLRLPVKEPWTKVAASNGTIAFGTKNREVMVYGTDGSPRWSFQFPPGKDEKESWSFLPKEVHNGRDGAVYVKTGDDMYHRVDRNGVTWSYPAGFIRNDQFEKQPPVLSPDGTTLYIQGKNALSALDEKTGKELWKKELTGFVAAPPLIDETGNLWVLTSEGTIRVLDPAGKEVTSWSTGSRPGTVNSARPQVAFAGNGYLCVMADQSTFSVFDRAGNRLLNANCAEIFWDRNYFDSFILTEGGSKAIIIGGSRSVGEIALPLTPEQKAEKILKDQQESAAGAPAIEDFDDFIMIDDVKMKKKR
jgi:outer membrane protein assembly factor BamB